MNAHVRELKFGTEKKDENGEIQLSMFDTEGNILVGQTKDEVVIYASAMQRQSPEILFFQINEIFTINGGSFWTAVPVRKTHDKQEIKLIPMEILSDIVNKLNAEKNKNEKIEITK